MKNFALYILVLVSGTVYAQVKPGQAAPEIKLEDADGNSFRLSEFKGKVVLIDFWASWCVPCRANNPKLLELYGKYKDKGFEILGVSIDNKKDIWQNAIRQDQLTWKQVIDDKGWNAESTIVYGVDAIPASFLLDKKGKIAGINMHGRQLEGKIKKLISQ
ncbi:MAG: TlpA disulfide reductase family protein [Chitinophagaceae bacterium]|nr:TlpA disulfide reductase family protein [Chitinophagaceae bacterium]